MVRAAVSGALDYSQADPTNLNWRLRQKLVLEEIQRREDIHLLETIQRQWLAYVSHGGLTEQSFADVKRAATELLDDIKYTIFPWIERPKKVARKDTMVDDATQKLIDQYKAMQRGWAAEEKTDSE